MKKSTLRVLLPSVAWWLYRIFSTLSHKRHDFLKKSFNKQNVF